MGNENEEKQENDNFCDIVKEKDFSSREKILFALYEFGRIKRKDFVDSEKRPPYYVTKNTFDRHIMNLIDEQLVEREHDGPVHIYSITESGIMKIKRKLEKSDLDAYIMDKEEKNLKDLIKEKSDFIKKNISDDAIILEYLELVNTIKSSISKLHDLKPKLDFLILYLAVNHPQLYPSYSISKEDFIKKYNLEPWEIGYFLEKVVKKDIYDLNFFTLVVKEKDLDKDENTDVNKKIKLFFRKKSQYGLIFESTINSHIKNFIYLVLLEKIEYNLESHRQVYKQIVSSLVEDYSLFHEDLRDVLNQLLIKIERKTMLDLIEKKNISQISFSKHYPTYLKLTTKLYRFEERKQEEYNIVSIMEEDFVKKYIFLKIKNDNRKLDAVFKEIDKLRINKNFSEAIDKLVKIIEKYPCAYAFNQSIEILCVMEDDSLALERIEKAINSNLQPSLFHFYKAEVLFNMRKFQEALESIEVSIHKNPNGLYK